MGLKVNVPLAIIRDAQGRLRHLYRGALVPSDLDKDHVDHLVDEGALVEESKFQEDPAPKPTAPPSK